MLPTALIALLLFIIPIAAEPNTTNDPFRAISLQVVPKPSPPICCLTPLPTTDPVEPDILLSFEEWKEKQAKDAAASASLNRSAQNATAGAETVHSSAVSPVPVDDLPSQDTHSQPLDAPHFRVPVTDRFNYASLDCSARTHGAHRSAKSASSILSSKRDRYMLSPCKTREKQFVVVELCDDIRIDTVQLANFEFFSGVFKDFTVSVAKTYSGPNEDSWVFAGTYRAKNVRGVQTWHPPTSLRDFYRFIRIDIHSHYSNEYYCPISLLRVYGLTHLEEWKWEIWEAESRAKHSNLEAAPAIDPKPTVARAESVSMPTESVVSGNVAMPDTIAQQVTPAQVSVGGSTESATSTSSSTSAAQSPATASPVVAEETNTVHENGNTITNGKAEGTLTSDPSSAKVTESISVPASPPSSLNAESNSVSSDISSSTASAITTTIVLPSPSATPSVPGSGESIYRTIMNRLSALESNHTLYTRYVEEQTNGIREMLRRLGEDVGRIEGIGKAQNQRILKIVTEWEAQRGRLEMDYAMLASRMDYLSDEIILEKRLGIAQLCLLMTVLVFMGLTRGSRGDDAHAHAPMIFNKRVREWSRRKLRLSLSSWSGRFGRSPSASTDEKAVKSEEESSDAKYGFPSAKPAPTPTPLTSAKRHTRHRSRTPSLRTPTTKHFQFPRSPPPQSAIPAPTPRPPRLKRANSHGGGISSPGVIQASNSWHEGVPKSAKIQRLARTAHLHEVKSPRIKLENGAERSPGGHGHALSLPSSDLLPSPGRGTEFGKLLDERPKRDSTAVLFSSPSPVDTDDVWEDTDTDASIDGFDDDVAL